MHWARPRTSCSGSGAGCASRCRRWFPNASRLSLRAQQPAMAAPVHQQAFQVGLRAAQACAVLGGDFYLLAEVAQGDGAASRHRFEAALHGLLLARFHEALVTARWDPGSPFQCFQLACFHGVLERRRIALVARLAAHLRAVAAHRGKILAELEALAFLAAGAVPGTLEHAVAQGAAQLARRKAAEENRARTLLQGRGAELGAALPLEIAPHQRRQYEVLAGHLPAAVGPLRGMQDDERASAAHVADHLPRFGAILGQHAALQRDCGEENSELHSGVSAGTRRCQSVACWYREATPSNRASEKWLPVSCRPTGSPFASKPQGIDSAGSPASGAGMVKMSFRYICTGSSDLAPMANAVVGAVGPRMTSQRPNAAAKSRAISLRTFCACR